MSWKIDESSQVWASRTFRRPAGPNLKQEVWPAPGGGVTGGRSGGCSHLCRIWGRFHPAITSHHHWRRPQQSESFGIRSACRVAVLILIIQHFTGYGGLEDRWHKKNCVPSVSFTAGQHLATAPSWLLPRWRGSSKSLETKVSVRSVR